MTGCILDSSALFLMLVGNGDFGISLGSQGVRVLRMWILNMTSGIRLYSSLEDEGKIKYRVVLLCLSTSRAEEVGEPLAFGLCLGLALIDRTVLGDLWTLLQ